MGILIRKAAKSDSEAMWLLMHELAIFEQYSDIFAITPEIVRNSGFEKSPPDFHCFVAEDTEDSKLAAMAVYYFIPYTAQNRPALYLKELFVLPEYRGKGIGKLLMEALQSEARATGCLQVKWAVAPWNEDGIRFYERLGAREDRDWLYYELNV